MVLCRTTWCRQYLLKHSYFVFGVHLGMSYVREALRKVSMVPTQQCLVVQVEGPEGNQSGAIYIISDHMFRSSAKRTLPAEEWTNTVIPQHSPVLYALPSQATSRTTGRAIVTSNCEAQFEA